MFLSLGYRHPSQAVDTPLLTAPSACRKSEIGFLLCYLLSISLVDNLLCAVDGSVDCCTFSEFAVDCCTFSEFASFSGLPSPIRLDLLGLLSFLENKVISQQDVHAHKSNVSLSCEVQMQHICLTPNFATFT